MVWYDGENMLKILIAPTGYIFCYQVFTKVCNTLWRSVKDHARIFNANCEEKKHVLFWMQHLLEVVHDLFEEQTSLDDVIMKIMERAQSLLKCERCTVLLKADSTSEVLILMLVLFSLS